MENGEKHSKTNNKLAKNPKQECDIIVVIVDIIWLNRQKVKEDWITWKCSG